MDKNASYRPNDLDPQDLTHRQSPALQTVERIPDTRNLDSKFLFEIFRLISFPDNVSFEFASPLAASGFFYHEDAHRVECVFCPASGKLGHEITHFPDCEKRRTFNKPLSQENNNRKEESRLLSFLRADWNKKVGSNVAGSIKSYPVSALELAKWGFFYLGHEDAARCAFCRLEVRGWEPNDTAEAEHKRWNPQCSFLRGTAVNNVKLGEEDGEENLAHDSAGLITRLPNFSRAEVQCSVIEKVQPRHQEYASEVTRMSSFNTWPISMPQRPEMLSLAGFYYTGKGDRVICFQCGGGLKDWGVTDEPWVEHAPWFPRHHVIVKKGREFIDRVQMLKSGKIKELKSGQIEELKSGQIEELKSDVPKDTKRSDGRLLCLVCNKFDLQYMSMTCFHVMCCKNCILSVVSCPRCSKRFKTFLPVFIA